MTNNILLGNSCYTIICTMLIVLIFLKSIIENSAIFCGEKKIYLKTKICIILNDLNIENISGNVL